MHTAERELPEWRGWCLFPFSFAGMDVGGWDRTELRTSEIRKDLSSSNQVLVDWALRSSGRQSVVSFFSSFFFFFFFWLAYGKGWLVERLVTTSWGYF